MAKKNYTPKTLELVERYRQLLLTSPTPAQVIEKLELRNKRAYHYLVLAYKDIYNNDEIKLQRASEIIEKINVVEKKSFNDYLKGEIKGKEYIDVLDYCIKLLAKYGLAPDDVEKIEIEHKGSYQVNLINHFKEVEKLLLDKKQNIIEITNIDK